MEKDLHNELLFSTKAHIDNHQRGYDVIENEKRNSPILDGVVDMPVGSEDVVRSESIIETIEQYDDEVTSNNQIDLEYIDAQEVPQDTYEEVIY